MSELNARIHQYYDKQGLRWPTPVQAVLWAMTELGEVAEVLLAREGDWVRNNPDDIPAHTPRDLAIELGDVIMMCQVAGMACLEDPLSQLYMKMEDKLGEAME